MSGRSSEGARAVKKRGGGGSASKRPSVKPGKARKAGKRANWTLRLLGLVFFLFAAGVLSLMGVLAYYGRDLPPVTKIGDYSPPQTTRVVDRNGRVIAELFEQRRTVVPMDAVPRVLVISVLAAEDADFYRHRGLDYAGILRALARDVLRGKPAQGASTITQQLVKNLLLTPERTLARKVKELILARRLEQELSKDEILHLYLNHIYFGHGRYGVEEASRFYFGKKVSGLTLGEASLLAGLPQAPSRLSPITHPEGARARQLYVLDQLARKRAEYWNDLPAEDIEKARAALPRIVGENESKLEAPEVATFAREMLESLVGEEKARHGGYRIETTLDLDLQNKAREALKRGLMTIDERRKLVGPLQKPARAAKLDKQKELKPGRTYDGVVTASSDASGEITFDLGGQRALVDLRDAARWNPEKLTASRFAPKGSTARVSIVSAASGKSAARGRMELGPQGAAVVIDPRTRDVLALVSGDTAEYGFNRALHALRQPGSTWKPITYALAIDSGKFTPASMVLDAPEVFDEWRPNNYETWSYAGTVRLRDALAQSINLVAVRMMTELTPEAVVELAKKLGISSPLDASLALALGASEVRPIELVNAYATFAAGGRYAPYQLVRSIRDARGRKLSLPKREAPRAVVSPAAAYVLTSMLQSVVQSGTAQAARKLQRPIAGKTGTSNQARDAWFVGYTPELVSGVWVGFDDHRPLGKGESGGKSALPIWMDIMQAGLGSRPAVEFPVPAGVERVAIDPKSGLRAYDGMPEPLDEVFVTGTAPTAFATPPDALDSAGFMVEQLTE